MALDMVKNMTWFRQIYDIFFTILTWADKLKEKLNNEVPLHKVEKVSTRTPTITVVGLKREYTNE